MSTPPDDRARGTASPKPTCEALLLSAAHAAVACDLSKRTWQKLDAQGRVPIPIRIGRRKLWALADLREWTARGCPTREVFEAHKAARAER